MHTILGHFDLDIDFWPHFLVYRVWSISPILQLTFLKCVLCLTNSFGGIRHVTVTFLVVSFIFLTTNCAIAISFMKCFLVILFGYESLCSK